MKSWNTEFKFCWNEVGPRRRGVGISHATSILVSIEYMILRSSTFLVCTGRPHLSAGCTDNRLVLQSFTVELQNEVNNNYSACVCRGMTSLYNTVHRSWSIKNYGKWIISVVCSVNKLPSGPDSQMRTVASVHWTTNCLHVLCLGSISLRTIGCLPWA